MELTSEEQRRLDALVAEATSVAATLIQKRRDYGTHNLAATGRIGLAARIVDKAHRVWNLSNRDTPRFEPLDDSLRDLIGYCLIYLYSEGGEQW